MADIDMKRKKNTAFQYWQAFLIPFAVMVIGCIGSGIYPFGNNSFLRNDLYNQYLQFFYALHNMVWEGKGLSYSFQLGLGSGFAALYGYYLASPFNWLVLLCPKGLIIEFITLLILIKMGLAGMSFAYYLEKHFGKRDFGVLFFSSAYALSGFMAAYQWNVMWLEVVVLAPLILWALEELVEKGRGLAYCGLLAYSIFTNFYLSIMLCIFLVLYFLTLILWKPWSVKWRRSIAFGFYSLLSGGMAAALLLPVYFALSGTEFHEFQFPSTVKWYMNFLEELVRHCMNVSMKVQNDHWPHLYCGVAMFLLVPLFVTSRRIPLKEKINKLFLMGIFLLSFVMNVLEFIWHGFNYPDSLPGRQAYLYSWLLLVMGYEVYQNLRYVRLWEIGIGALAGYGIVIAGWFFTDVEGTEDWTFVLTLVFMSLYLILLLLRYAWIYPLFRKKLRAGRWKKLLRYRYFGVKLIVGFVVILELAVNMYWTSIRTTSRTKFVSHFTDAAAGVSWMKEADPGLYRTEIFERLTKNDSFIWDINTTTVFSSTVSAGVVDFYQSVGLGTTRVSYWYQGATPLISAMLGVKYMVGTDASYDNDLYELVYSDDTGYIYACKYSLPIGYMIDRDVAEAWNMSYYDPIGLQNQLCELLGIEEVLFAPAICTKLDEQTYTVETGRDAYIYVCLGKNSLTGVEVTNGERTKKFSQVSFDYLLDLGLVRADVPATVKVTEEDEHFGNFSPYKLNLSVLGQAVDALGAGGGLRVTEYGAGYVKGSVTAEASGLLVITIPVEKGWTLYVDGEERDIQTFQDAFIAAELDEGEHEICLQYRTPGLKAGMLISVISWGIYIGLLLRRKPFKKCK